MSLIVYLHEDLALAAVREDFYQLYNPTTSNALYRSGYNKPKLGILRIEFVFHPGEWKEPTMVCAAPHSADPTCQG